MRAENIALNQDVVAFFRRLIEDTQTFDNTQLEKAEKIEAVRRALAVLDPPSYVPRTGEYEELYEGMARVKRLLERIDELEADLTETRSLLGAKPES